MTAIFGEMPVENTRLVRPVQPVAAKYLPKCGDLLIGFDGLADERSSDGPIYAKQSELRGTVFCQSNLARIE